MAERPRDQWVFGSDESCDVRIKDDPYVSNRHCVIRMVGGTPYIEDLGSTNGTWVRYDRVRSQHSAYGARVYGPMAIRPGVVVRIGHTDIPWEATDSG